MTKQNTIDRIRIFLDGYGLYVVVLIAMLPAILLRDFTPDNELRYVSIAAESLREGTFFAFTNHGIAYADKPPLYLWICMAGYALFGNHCLPFVTLFSVLPAFVITEIMARWSAPSLPERWRLPAKLMLLTSTLFIGLALTMRMDMLMAMFIVLALRMFWRRYNGDESPRTFYLFPIYLFLALFTKGPYGILIPLGAIVAFLIVKKKLRTFTHFWGWRCWCILIILSALWFAAVYLEGGTQYLDNLLFKQTVGRAVKSFAHNEPFYFYLISIWYSIAPWSPAVIGAIIGALVVRRHRIELPETALFFITTAISSTALLSCFSAKLSVYLLPAFPFFIYGSASCIALFSRSGWIKAALALPATIFLLLAAVLPFVAKIPVITKFTNHLPALLIVGVSFLAVSGLVALILLYRRNASLPGAITSIGTGFLLFLFFSGFCIGDFNDHIGYRDLAEKTDAAIKRTGLQNVYTYRVRRPENMDVYLGRDIIIIDDHEDGTVTYPPKETGLLLMREKDLKGTEEILGKSGKYVIIKN